MPSISLTNNKKDVFLLVVLLILVLILVSGGIFVYLKTLPLFPDNLKSEGSGIAVVNSQLVNPNRINKFFDILNDKSQSNKNRYSALDSLAFLYEGVYVGSNDPAVRVYLEKLGEYGQKNFPSLFDKNEFTIGCHDPTCGPKMSSDLQQIYSDISNSKEIDSRNKTALLVNIKSANYLEQNNYEEKYNVLTGAAGELKFLSKSASSSSILKISDELYTYIKNNYPDLYKQAQEDQNRLKTKP